MPTLTIPNSFTNNTVADATQVNANFNAVATLLNSTKLDGDNLQTGGVPTGAFADLSVTADKLAADAVTTDKIDDEAVTAAKIAEDVIALLTPSGMVSAYAGTSAPTGWLICDGSPVSRSTYSALFTAVGEAHGEGDGSTTFNLPDYRWRTLRGYGANITAACADSAASNNVTATAHGFKHTGIRVRVTGTPVTGLLVDTSYFVVVVDANTLAFATTRANAYAATKITISGSAASMTVIQYEDPDAASREAMSPGGTSGAGVGSIQDDAFGSHNHSASTKSTAGTSTTRLATVDSGSGINDSSATAILNTGGSETRAKNAYVNFIIKT